MVIFKRLFFAIPFLLCFFIFSSQLEPLLRNIDFIWSLSQETFIQIITTVSLLILTSIFWVTFITLCQDWRLILPVLILSGITPLVTGTSYTHLMLSSGYLISLGTIFLILQHKLSTYLTFQATALLVPSVKQTVTLILLIASFIFYFSAREEINNNGFQIPDSLLEMSLQFANLEQGSNISPNTNSLIPSQLSIPKEQLDMLKSQPELLSAYGLDPSIIEMLDKPTTVQTQTIDSKDLMKEMIKKQVASFIEPYLIYMPLILTAIFFPTLNFFASLLGLLITPLILIIFSFLEAIGFTHYESEQREVKKLVV